MMVGQVGKIENFGADEPARKSARTRAFLSQKYCRIVGSVFPLLRHCIGLSQSYSERAFFLRII